VAALIAARRAQDGIPHAVACRALGVSRSWFYKHRDGWLPPRAQRRERLNAEVARLFALHEGKEVPRALPLTCGTPGGGSARTPSPR
jgi:hypothetical protein